MEHKKCKWLSISTSVSLWQKENLMQGPGNLLWIRPLERDHDDGRSRKVEWKCVGSYNNRGAAASRKKAISIDSAVVVLFSRFCKLVLHSKYNIILPPEQRLSTLTCLFTWGFSANAVPSNKSSENSAEHTYLIHTLTSLCSPDKWLVWWYTDETLIPRKCQPIFVDNVVHVHTNTRGRESSQILLAICHD